MRRGRSFSDVFRRLADRGCRDDVLRHTVPGTSSNNRKCLVTFRMRRSRGEIYIGHGRPCICRCVCLSVAAFSHYCTDPDLTWGNGRGCLLVVHYCANLQSVIGFRCYDNIAPNAKCQRVLVLAVCLVTVGGRRVGVMHLRR